jgi:hypothetical protein
MAPDRWFFPTNSDNLKAILTHGLLCGSEGYEKYYTDISSDFPGFVPIFRNGKGGHSKAVSKANKEGNDLVLCLLEINLDQIVSGNVSLIDNTQMDISAYTNQSGDEQIDEILLPSPLPSACIKQVLFYDSHAKNTFENDLNRYGDTPQGGLKHVVAQTKSDKNLFSQGNSQQVKVYSPSETAREEHSGCKQFIPLGDKTDYKKVYSLGGLLCTLFYFAKNGSYTNEILASCVKLAKIEKIDNKDLINPINNYFYQTEESAKNNNSLFFILHHVLNILVKERNSECFTSIVQLLQSGVVFEKDEHKTRAREIAKKLVDFYQNKIDAKASEIFSNANPGIEKMLLLMTHRDDVKGLMGTNIAELEVFTEQDYIVAAMLFGIRSKYYNIPLSLRQYRGVNEYISYLMAQYAHDIRNTGVKFKKNPAPLTVMDMVASKGREKSKKLGFINWLSNKHKIRQNCFETIMPNKKFVNDRGKSTYHGVVLPDIKLKEQEYFKAISKIEIDDRLYETILKKYKSV